ncbi:MAG: alpha-ketoglutarate-dependent dioxygenase AlkB [Coleofasciculus sp. S288]|nr:alpha-ketoglutarate-dependent dioxygenase AlkB [Coleofasciculus sp. S288]
MMLSPKETRQDSILRDANVKGIIGLTYVPNYIDEDEQNQLLNIIDQQEWSTKLKRRVQQYGYRYEYQKGILASSSYLGELPDWAGCLAERLYSDRLTAQLPDQVIVNEYEPGQGITSHIDCIPCFGKTIISLSLGSPCVMEFIHSQTQGKAANLLLPGSLMVMQGAARYIWQHGIAARKKDLYEGREIIRTRRVSLTFREVLFPYK